MEHMHFAGLQINAVGQQSFAFVIKGWWTAHKTVCRMDW